MDKPLCSNGRADGRLKEPWLGLLCREVFGNTCAYVIHPHPNITNAWTSYLLFFAVRSAIKMLALVLLCLWEHCLPEERFEMGHA